MSSGLLTLFRFLRKNRVVFCTAAIIATISLRVFQEARQGPNAFYFEVVACSPDPQRMQLFFQTEDERGYSEERSIWVNLTSSAPKSFRFPLSPGAYTAFRFDPMCGAGTARFFRARLVEANTDKEVCGFPVAQWEVNGEGYATSVEGDVLTIVVPGDKNDPNIELAAPGGMVLLGGSRFYRFVLNATFFCAAFSALSLVGFLPCLPAVAAQFRLIQGCVTSIRDRAQSIIPGTILPIDNAAVVFVLLVLFACALLSGLGWHGSSSAVRGPTAFPGGDWQPLLGSAKGIRSDEWNTQTPIILHQLNRKDPLAVESIVGPKNSILIANAPAKHWSMIFRPQLWPFFILDNERAYSTSWQSKNAILIVGTFFLFLLLTHSTHISAFGATWYFFSSYTQWALSWPSQLPVLVGTASFSVVLATIVLFSHNRVHASIFGCLLVLVTVDFALCAYPPHQVPLVLSAIALFFSILLARTFCLSRTELKSVPFFALPAGRERVPHDLRRLDIQWSIGPLALLAAAGLTIIIVSLFIFDIWRVVQIAASTVYPGHRSVDGGGVSWAWFVSCYLDLYKSESHFPGSFPNICEGCGYFWLAPITFLISIIPVRSPWRAGYRSLHLLLFAPFLVLFAWMAFPIPASYGKFLALNMAMPVRVTPALGLLNIAITLTFLRFGRTSEPIARDPISAALRFLPFVVATTTAIFGFGAMNGELGDFFTRSQLFVASVAFGAATLFLFNRSTKPLAVLLVGPLIWANMFINPVERGLSQYEMTPLRAFIDQHQLRDGRWLLFSGDYTAPQYLGALGVDVFNFFSYVPDLDSWSILDPDQKYMRFYNGSGTTFAKALPIGEPIRMEEVGNGLQGPPYFRCLCIDLTDSRIERLGIRYLAFDRAPDPALVPADRFELLNNAPVDGLTIFRVR